MPALGWLQRFTVGLATSGYRPISDIRTFVVDAIKQSPEGAHEGLLFIPHFSCARLRCPYHRGMCSSFAMNAATFSSPVCADAPTIPEVTNGDLSPSRAKDSLMLAKMASRFSWR